jgi:hypothetical protein
MMIEADLDQLNVYSSRDSDYSGAPLDRYCPFTLHIYPSDAMEDVYSTQNPMIFTIAAVMIFVFTSILFISYDKMVERRQTLVMNTAVRTSAIVDSLYPEAVRDKLSVDAEPDTDLNNSRPVADLYPETTVFFCDIVGFTAWSSTREPWEVFHLLETIYNAFDAIAHQRKVFKVETVGDCCTLKFCFTDHRFLFISSLTWNTFHLLFLQMLLLLDYPHHARIMPPSWPDLPEIVAQKCVNCESNWKKNSGR